MPFLSEILIFLLAVPLGLGIGSGGFFLVYLSDVLSLQRESAVYLNLLFFLCALLSSAFIHLRAGRARFPLLGFILLFGIPGAIGGQMLSGLLPPTLLRVFLGLFLIGSGVFSLLTLKKAKDARNSLDKERKKDYNYNAE